jgi:RNA polymerase sigma-70 factor (ECF subfamily)
MNRRELEAQLERLHLDSFGWALSCCGHDETEAEDVLQTTYLKIVTGKARYEGRSSFRTWVFGVIRRTAQELSRRARIEGERMIRLVRDDLEDPSAERPDRELGRADAARNLAQAMRRLSERQREILHLVFYQDLSIKEAAEVMEISLGSARTHYQRGKVRLKDLLGEDENVA